MFRAASAQPLQGGKGTGGGGKGENRNSIIYNSLLKNGYSNFTLEILEFCTAENCIKKEQYYIDLLKPEYNLLPTAGSWLGYKHLEESRAKMGLVRLGKKNIHRKRELKLVWLCREKITQGLGNQELQDLVSLLKVY